LVRLAVSPAIFEETNSLWIVNSPIPEKTPGEGLQHALDVIGRVHVGGVEARDHGIEAGLLLLGQGAIGHGDEGVGERVVVERRVRLQVVGGGEVARVPVGPGLLQGMPKSATRPTFVPMIFRSAWMSVPCWT
jgi:hypothetical protein